MFNLCQSLFIRNTKIDTNIGIPEPIITNNILIQTPLEKIIYEGEPNKLKKIQLCSHILVSEDNINILGKQPLSFKEIYEKMNNHYTNNIIQTKRIINNKIKKIKKTSNYDSALISNIETYISDMEQIKINGKTNLEEPINLEEQNNLEEPTNLICDIVENDTKKISDYYTKLISYNFKKKMYDKLNVEITSLNECSICFESFDKLQKTILYCGHYFCVTCVNKLFHKNTTKCPICRTITNKKDIQIIKSDNIDSKWGTKILNIIDYINNIEKNDVNAKFIIFSQWDNMLKLISKILTEYNKQFVFIKGSAHTINKCVLKFKLNKEIKIILLSSDKNVSGLNLVEANYIILLDTFNTDKSNCQIIEEQAIGRAYRIGQTKQVQVSRFIMKDTLEEIYFKQNCI